MRIQVLSDLHLEYGGHIPPLVPGAAIVVMAGDLAPASGSPGRLMAEAWTDAEHILYVPGNHEFHGSDIEEARRQIALDCGLCGVTLLDTAAVTIGPVRFIGATLWTDFLLDGAAREATSHKEIGERFSDFTGAIRDWNSPEGHGLLTTREAARRHARDIVFIQHEIARAHEAGLEAAVVTHHAPSPVSIHFRYAGSQINPAYISDLDAMIVHLRHRRSGSTAMSTTPSARRSGGPGSSPIRSVSASARTPISYRT